MVMLKDNMLNLLKMSKNNKLAIGIDLGTTYSLVATVLNDNITILKDHKKRKLLPSVVHYEKNSVLVGWEAKKYVIEDPINTITSVKRLIGHSLKYLKGHYPYLPYFLKLNNKSNLVLETKQGDIRPLHVLSEILISLSNRTRDLLRRDIDGVVITVPAYFNNLQREETKMAAHLAGLKVLRLLNEPTAAAIAYGLSSKKEGIILVYDLGGGTFDVSILKLSQGIFEVLSTGGDSSLGGDDFDQLLVNYFREKVKIFKKEFDKDLYLNILKNSERVKISLTNSISTFIKIEDKKIEITRNEFDLLIEPIVKHTLLICQSVLEDANLSAHEIQEIIMVGGSTRIPLIKKMISNFFNQKALTVINPEEVVAMGAAIQANMLIGNHVKNRTILLDVTPLSLGIEVMGNFVEKIIFKNTTIPVAKSKEFTTYKENQTTMKIHVLQGESDNINECRSLATFLLKEITPKSAGGVRVLVIFQLDENGILNVTAMEKNKNNRVSIQVDTIYDLCKF